MMRGKLSCRRTKPARLSGTGPRSGGVSRSRSGAARGHPVLLAAGFLVGLGPVWALAEEWSRSLPAGRTLTLYGQTSPTTLTVDDGVESHFSIRDNAHATTRLGFDVTRRLGERTIRWSFESGFGIPTTSGTSQTSANDRWAFGDATVRKAELRLTGPLGEWSFGQGSTATDGVATQDLSGTDVVGSSAIRDDAGSFRLRSAATGGLTSIRLGDAFANFDGKRRLRVRYDTPRRRGYSIAVAAGLDDFLDGAETFADAAIRFETAAAALRLRAAAGVSWQREEAGEDELAWLGSMSAFHRDSGVSLTAAAGLQIGGGRYAYLKGGYRIAPFGFGDTAATADMFFGRDNASQGARSRSTGMQLVQFWDSRNIEAYLGYRRYAYDDRTPESYHDAHTSGLSL